ncbi:MAG: ASPIC/UnbV domain-containing protein, partial [Planctomycetales bacterium]|nr:ASPIC/UnbV domain-containing protein [Planctomycetales bacterium]
MSQSPDSFQQLDRDHAYLHNFDALGLMIGQGRSFSGRESHCLFLNTRDNRFSEVAAATGFNLLDDGRAACVTDWDSDGDLDVWLTSRIGPRVRLLQNNFTRSNNARYLALQLKGNIANRDAVGARVKVEYLDASGTQRQAIKTLRAGDGFLSQSSKWLHFGLGDTASIDRVTVRWPRVVGLRVDNEEQTITGLELDQRFVVTQATKDKGSGSQASPPVQAIAPRSPVHLPAEHAAESDVGTKDDSDSGSQRVFFTQRKP